MFPLRRRAERCSEADVGCSPAATWYYPWDSTTRLLPTKPCTWLFTVVGSGGPPPLRSNYRPDDMYPLTGVP